ncbi:hypothetical protein [Larkinella rosea]|uniref:Outer membrane protein beta-barrel domain-containing protein n=1 Tax=Larkinella rosea TaxID=2025312 RepID=A0A3P1BG53_9BACT|nr:hypothetical protein [Larkinella rosea]RRB00069.1 hypothetical protein EHT25_25940 [Larkinella rosea]
MKTIALLLVGILIQSDELIAQSNTFRIGLNAVPLANRTIELNASLTGKGVLEFYGHGGYTLPGFYAKDKNDFSSRYWEGTGGGAYLRIGARTFLNKTGQLRLFLGTHLTAGYLQQAEKSTTVIKCFIGPCPPLVGEGKNEQYSLSAGITAGVKVNILPRFTLDLGVLANRFLFEKPDLNNPDMYIPGYGRKPVQAVASVQYILKGR